MTFSATEAGVAELWEKLAARIAAGDRFAGLFAALRRPHSGDAGAEAALVLSAHVAAGGGIDTVEAALPPGAASYPALTPLVGAAFWYERVIHDEFGVVPRGHPRLAPLVLHGSPEDHALPRHVAGYGMFTIPHGPVRSGVMESIEYLVETPGEAIPHLNMRVFYKHRGIEKRFEGMSAADGVLVAERAEGIASVAHTLAYCHAIERIAGCTPPESAGLVRVLHAELERIANHVDVAAKLADAAGLAVATARFAVHKERVLRLVSGLCGSRFGRGVGCAWRCQRAAPDEPWRHPGRAWPAGEGHHGGRRFADGHLLVPGPAARHRPAAPGAGACARGTGPHRQSLRVLR